MDSRRKNVLLASVIAVVALLIYVYSIFKVVASAPGQ